MRMLFLFLLTAFLIPVAGWSQPANCSDGLIFDDGGFETGYQPSTVLFRGNMAQLIPVGSIPARLSAVCVCFNTDILSDDSVNFDLRVWAADGPGGSPGSLLGEIPNVRLSNITSSGRFVRVDLSPLNLTIGEPVYVGPSWFPGQDDVFVCTDESPGTAKQKAYLEVEDLFPSWSLIGVVGRAPNFRSFGIRAKLDEDVGGATCTPGETTLCLNKGRFRVEVEWSVPSQGTSGLGHVVSFGTPDSGLFWFFDSNNWEMMVKVLNGCALTDHYWVFVAATTNVEYTIHVTDTATDQTWERDKQEGPPAPAITDTAAFATCP